MKVLEGKKIRVKIHNKVHSGVLVIKENHYTFWVEFNGRHIKRKWRRDL